MITNRVVADDISSFVKLFPFKEDVTGKTFLITGVTGLIGSTITRCLLALNANIKIVAIARNKEKADKMYGDAPISWIYQDMCDELNIGNYQIDYIIHCANSTSSKFYVEHPVENINTAFQGTNSLLSYCSNHRDVKGMVYLSSLETYGSNYDDCPITEEKSGYINPLDVRSSYSLGKRMVECLCHSYAKEYGVPVKIARLTQTFGAGVSLEDTRVFAQFAKSVIKGDDIVLHTKGESAKPYCYTIDAVIAIFYLLLKGENGDAYNIANSNTYISIHDMAQFLAKEFKPACKVIVELHDDMGYAPVTKLNLNTDKLQSLGWEPHYNLRDMFSQLIEYYKN